MKVQLVFAPPVDPPKYGELGENITPPLGILYLSGYLRKMLPDVHISVVDGLKSGYKKTMEKIEEFGPDILGLSFYTPVALSAYQLINEVRGALPSTFIIAGGPHASALPEEVLKKSDADAVAIGEGEETLYKAVRTLRSSPNLRADINKLKDINGVAFRSEEAIVKTVPRKFIKDINRIPYPARDLINLRDYSGWYIHKELPETKMFFSRGCPYHCTFCDAIIWKSSKPWVRLRSPENIVDEIEHLSADFGIREIMDDSDEFNNSESHAIAICEEMKSRNLKIPWKTQLRAWPLSEKLVKAMAESGCWYVHLGIESGNPETLKGIKKHITVEQVKEACRRLKKYNIQVLGLFMLFNVWEENGDLRYEDVNATKKTFSFIEELINDKLLDYIGWSVTTPYPGSQLYDIAQKFDLIKPHLRGEWDAWLKDDIYIMNLPGVNEKDMVRMKTMGQMLRARLILKSRRYALKDLPFFAQKGIKLLRDEARNILKPNRK